MRLKRSNSHKISEVFRLVSSQLQFLVLGTAHVSSNERVATNRKSSKVLWELNRLNVINTYNLIHMFYPGYVNEMFIALQHEISSELVSRLTGQDLKTFKVNIQRYPHPPYTSDPAANILRIMFPMFIMLSFSYTATNIVRAIAVEKELQLKVFYLYNGLLKAEYVRRYFNCHWSFSVTRT